MTIGDYPEYLAIGYLLNQNMLLPDDVVTGVDYDEELAVVVVRTKRKTNYEKKLKKKVQTSGCAQGTVFGDLMEALEDVTLPKATLRTSWLYALTHKINTTPSLYLEAGAIHGCVLAKEDQPLVYMEDVGRHNAVDKIAGWMFKEKVKAADKIFYTTGRLTSEMVIKTVRMGIPILISRSGFTAWGVELARKANLTLIGRARGKRFVALAGEDRIVFDQDLARSRKKAVSTVARPPCMMNDAFVNDDCHPIPPTLGLVLAGGLARRMGGGDKARIEIGGVSILDRVLATLSGQCTGMIINANGDPARFADTGVPVVPDNVPDYPGPLAGILAGLDWLAARTTASNGCSACRATALSCPTTWWNACMRRGVSWAPACGSRARARANGGIRWSAYGRWRCARVCARRWSTKACARSRSGPRGMASRSPIGRPSRSTRSSMSTRPRMPSARRALRCSIQDSEILTGLRRTHI